MNFLDILRRRYACKRFDGSKLSAKEITFILECGRLSPSSFGMEPWRFLVIESQKIKEDLQPLCWNQPQITTCSHLVIIKGDKEVVQDREYVRAMFERRGLDEAATNAYIQRYFSFLAKIDIGCWVGKQCYIAAANMMSGAASIDVDSCPIEGFDPQKLHDYFHTDTQKEEILLLIAFGHCATEPPPKKRLPLEKIVRFL